jgi:hypothetical protein
VSTSLTNALRSTIDNDPVPFERSGCTDSDSRIGALAADLASAVPLACVVSGGRTGALGPFDFDLALDLLLHGSAVTSPSADDGSGVFTGADARLG